MLCSHSRKLAEKGEQTPHGEVGKSPTYRHTNTVSEEERSWDSGELSLGLACELLHYWFLSYLQQQNSLNIVSSGMAEETIPNQASESST